MNNQFIALKAAALAATQGEWKWWTSNSYLRLSAKGDGDVLHGARLSDGACTVNVKPCDQAFIAAANPAAILSLIAAVESAEAGVQPVDCSDDADWLEQFAKVDGATAFHLIERHGENWADCGRLIDLYVRAKAAAPQLVESAEAAKQAQPALSDGRESQTVAQLRNSLAGWQEECEALRRDRDSLRQRLDLQALHQKNDVWYWQGDGTDYPESMSNSMAIVIRGDQLRAILAASQQPAAAPQPVAVPDGYVLVPVVPTEAMLEAKPESAGIQGQSASSMKRNADIAKWNAMLAAAPAAPSPAVPARSSMGLPSCGKPLCSESDHHPLCSQRSAPSPAVQPAQAQGEPWKWLVSWGMGDEEICQSEALAKRQKRLLDENGWLNVVIEPIYRAAQPAAQPAQALGEAATEDKLQTLLTAFDMGLGFALCHRGFGETREAIKKLQQDFAEIRVAIAAQPAVQPAQAQGDVTMDAALADTDKVPYLIVFDDADQENEPVIGGTRARYRFKQISGAWNAHLYVKIASNSRDEIYPSAVLAAQPAVQPAQWDADATQRLRSIVAVLGLQDSVPEGDLTGYEFAVLGTIRRAIEQLKAVQPAQAPRKVNP